MRNRLIRFLPLLSLLAAGAAAAAVQPAVSLVNGGSFARAQALPLLGEGAVATDGAARWRVTVGAANEFYTKGGDLFLDAETLQLDLGLRQTFAPGWEWGLRLPLLSQSGGAMDGLIENWHSTFGLPNGGRERFAKDGYRIQYTHNGQTLLDLRDGHNGLGDVQAVVGWQWQTGLALRGLLQLPTGQASTLSGGHAGVALWAEWTPEIEALPSVRSNLATGVSISTTRGPLKSIQKPVVAFARSAVSLPIYGGLQGNVSLQFHSAFYDDTGQKPISGPGGNTGFGFGFPLWGAALNLGVEEDILLNTAPDFALRLSVAYGGN